MKNLKFFSLFLSLVFVVSSCTKDDAIQQNDRDQQIAITQLIGSECQDNFDYPFLPESNFLDGYYELLTAAFTEEQMTSCDCVDLLAIHAFRNDNIINFLPFQMTPMELTCEELQVDCESSEEDIDENLLVENLMIPFNEALAENLILEDELNLMKDFFNDFIIEDEVNFDYYWCQLESVDKPSGIDEDVAGLLSAYTLTFYQSPYDYFTATDPENITSGTNIELRISRWVKWATIIGTRSVFGVFKKYVDSMGVLIDGVRDGQDTSYQALCTALD